MAVGYGSMFIVLLVAGFRRGGDAASRLATSSPGSYRLYVAGGIIAESMILELGPGAHGLILAGRIGARYAAELGTHARHRADRCPGEPGTARPVTHLLLPRIWPGMIAIPALVDARQRFRVRGGLASRPSRRWALTNAGLLEFGARYFFRPLDLWYSVDQVVRSSRRAVTIIPCYIGFNTQQGAEGVGRATTQAVVAASVTVLMLDTVLTAHPAGTAKWYRAQGRSSKRFVDNVVLDGVGLQCGTKARRWRCSVPRASARACCSSTSSGSSSRIPVKSGWTGSRSPLLGRKELAAPAQPHRLRVPERRTVRLDGRVREHPARHHRRGALQRRGYCVERVRECLRLVNLAPTDVGRKYPVRAVGRHAQARGHRAGDRRQAEIPACTTSRRRGSTR